MEPRLGGQRTQVPPGMCGWQTTFGVLVLGGTDWSDRITFHVPLALWEPVTGLFQGSWNRLHNCYHHWIYWGRGLLCSAARGRGSIFWKVLIGHVVQCTLVLSFNLACFGILSLKHFLVCSYWYTFQQIHKHMYLFRFNFWHVRKTLSLS